MTFNHSAPNYMKSLLIIFQYHLKSHQNNVQALIYQMKDLIDAKIFLKKKHPAWCAAIILKNPYLLFQKMSTAEKHEKLLQAKKRALLCNFSTLVSNQLSAEHCSNVIVLIYTAKIQRMHILMGTLARIYLTSIIL